MRYSQLLELIWQGEIQPATGASAQRIQRALNALLPLRTVLLAASCGVDRGYIVNENTELLPELPLGDVLAEELSIDVPIGSMVVIGNVDLFTRQIMDDELSYDLGVFVSEALLGIIRSGTFSMGRETDALYAMACSYNGMIDAAGFLHLGLMPGHFRAGLAAGLCTYWAGARSARSDTSGLFLRPDFLSCPKLHSYLRQMDGNFTAPERIPAGLMLFARGYCTYESWIAQTERVVTAELDAWVAKVHAEDRPDVLRARTSPDN